LLERSTTELGETGCEVYRLKFIPGRLWPLVRVTVDEGHDFHLGATPS